MRFHYPVKCIILIEKSFVPPFMKKEEDAKKVCTKGVYQFFVGVCKNTNLLRCFKKSKLNNGRTNLKYPH